MRKKISVVIPTYNEEANVVPLSQAIIEVMEKDLSEYDYEILFIDNHSKDNTKALLRGLCANNRKIKAIFNAKNFGQARSPVYGMKQAYGDCVVRMCADFQDPVDMIPQFVREWEKGTKIVIGVKSASKERRGMYLVRECYYRLINKITDIDHIDQFTGFGLYDRKFVDVVRDLHDPMPYLRGIIAELGFDYKAIEYTQPKRRAGKSKNNFYSLYDYAMIGITSYSKVVMRLQLCRLYHGDSAWQQQWSIWSSNSCTGSLFSRSCTDGDRYVFPGGIAVVLYRTSWGIRSEH